MKHPALYTIFALAMVGGTSVRGATVTHIASFQTENIKINTVTTHDGFTFTEIELPGTEPRMEIDEPMIPVKYFNVRVPENSRDFSARITGGTTKASMTLDHSVKPFKTCTTNENPYDISYAELTGNGYGTSDTRPRAEVVNEFFLNGSDHFVTFAVYPIGYQGRSNTLTITDDLKVELTYSECSPSEMPNFRPLKSERFTAMYNSDALEYYEVNSGTNVLAKAPKKSDSANEYSNSMEGATNYVIMVPYRLISGVQRLRKWKQQKGYNVTVMCYEQIYSNAKYALNSTPELFDKEAQVREWLRDYYSENGTFFCLMVGDWRTDAPVRKFFQPTSNVSNLPIHPYDERYEPSDIYFNDLVTSWEHTTTASGMEVLFYPKFSFSPTISTGRILVSRNEELEIYTDKLIRYECYPNKGDFEYLNNGSLIRHSDGDSSDNNSIFDALKFLNVDSMVNNKGITRESLEPKPKDVLLRTSDSGIISYQCHAGLIGFQIADIPLKRDSISHIILPLTSYRSAGWRYNHVSNFGFDEMTNTHKPNIIYTMGCDVIVLDPVSNDEDGVPQFKKMMEYNMASAYTVSGLYGGVAMLANTRAGFWSISPKLEKAFSNALLLNNSVGIAENMSKLDFTSTLISLRHNLIGDPEFKIWTSAPAMSNYTFNMSSNGLDTSVSAESDIQVGCSLGENGIIKTIHPTTSRLQMPITDLLYENQSATIGSMWIKEKNKVAGIYLFSTGKEISGEYEYTLINCELGRSNFPAYSTFLNVGPTGNLKLHLFESLNSNDGLHINGGSVDINSETKIILTNDSISNNGILTLDAQEVVLNRGFSVEQGSTLIIK